MAIQWRSQGRIFGVWLGRGVGQRENVNSHRYFCQKHFSMFLCVLNPVSLKKAQHLFFFTMIFPSPRRIGTKSFGFQLLPKLRASRTLCKFYYVCVTGTAGEQLRLLILSQAHQAYRSIHLPTAKQRFINCHIRQQLKRSKKSGDKIPTTE